MSKNCQKCKEVKDTSEFHKNRAKHDGLCGYCKACREKERRSTPAFRAKRRALWSRNRDEDNVTHRNWKRLQRIGDLRRKYGMTLEDYDELYRRQDGACAICKEPFEAHAIHTHVDHCHSTGRVRGILCRGCNQGIGAFKEKDTIMESAIRYINDNNLLNR